MLVLYNHDLSVCVQKVRLAMAEKGLAWQDLDVDLMRGEQMSPDYLKLNPKGVVPTLVHDGQPIIESTIILEYLDDAFPDPPLRPADAPGRARMRLWARVPDDGLHAACGTVSYAAAFGQQVLAFHGREALEARIDRVPDRARAARQRELYEKGFEASFLPDQFRLYDKALRDMETALADRDWLAGDTFSLADCAMLPYVYRLDRLNLGAMWADRPRLADWYGRAQARPSWKTAIVAYPGSGTPDYDDDLKSKGIDLWPKLRTMLAA